MQCLLLFTSVLSFQRIQMVSSSMRTYATRKATGFFALSSLLAMSLQTTSSASGGPPTPAVPASQLPSATTTASSSSAPNVSVVPVDTVAARVLQSLLSSAQHLGVLGVSAAPATAVSSSLPQPAAGAGTSESCVLFWWFVVEYTCVLSVCSLGFFWRCGAHPIVLRLNVFCSASHRAGGGGSQLMLGARSPWSDGQLGALPVFFTGYALAGT